LAAAPGPTPPPLAQGAAPGGWPPPAGPPQGSGLVNPAPGPQTQTADRQALTDVKSAAIIAIIGFACSVVGSYFYSTYGAFGLGITCSAGTCSTTSVSLALLGGLFAVIAVGIIFDILSILRFRSAFRALLPVDYRFRSPANLSILLVIGLVLILLGFGLLLGSVGPVINACSSSNYNYTSCSNAATGAAGLLLSGVGVIGLGAILGLIGGIVVLLGIWRLGTRYNESLLQVGAILLIIPFVDIAAPFLIYFGARQAEQRVGPAAGIPPFVPGVPPRTS